MTSRQARTERRAAERKARKAELRRLKQAAIDQRNQLPLEEEFSPELIREATAARERIHRAAGITPIPAPGFVSHPDGFVSHPDDFVSQQEGVASQAGFVSQHAQEPSPPAPTSRTLANRANAQYSTGPRSMEGKLASSRNSLQHGLASGTILIPGEDPAQFEALRNDLLAEYHPATATEELLVQEMAQSFWLSQRALRFQNGCFTETGVDEKRLALFLRYQTTHERAFHKALNTLRKLQKERALGYQADTKSGFVSQSAARSAPGIGFVSQCGPQPPSSAPNFGTANVNERPSDGFVWQNRRSEAA
jgi:hypothetical protein